MRILIFVLALASQTLSVVGVPSNIGSGNVIIGSDRLAHDEKDETREDKKKGKSWVRRKRTVVV